MNARSESNLILAVYFIKHRYRVSRDVNFRNVMLAWVRKLASQREIEEDSTEVYVTYIEVHNNDRLKILEGVEEYIRTSRGVNFPPLS